jgi:hypothetical protein
MLINGDFEISYLMITFTLLGVILVGALLTALRLDRWHPKLIGAAVGALLGIVLIETVPIVG